MRAREKLNHMHISGSIFLAGLLGALFQSWLAFAIALASLIATSLHLGDIRLKKGPSDRIES